jgi:hypothetical protein
MVGMRKASFMVMLAAVGLTARPALAATSYRDAVIGVEIAATATEGQFVGTAAGQLPGAWHITVDHQPLAGATPAAITGGSLGLATLLAGRPTTVTGVFSGGSVTQISGFSGCTNQTLVVSGTLADVGTQVGSQATGTGVFSATLTHYQVSIFGRCVAYSASIAGSVTLSF